MVLTGTSIRKMEKKEEIREWLEKLRCCEKTIIVEGKKDKSALESFGISNVFAINSKPHYKVVEEVAKSSKDCIILTDLDREGKKIYGTLNSGLQRFGVRIDHYFREFLLKNTKLRQIEGLKGYSKSIDFELP